jgi:hypothetical protein
VRECGGEGADVDAVGIARCRHPAGRCCRVRAAVSDAGALTPSSSQEVFVANTLAPVPRAEAATRLSVRRGVDFGPGHNRTSRGDRDGKLA